MLKSFILEYAASKVGIYSAVFKLDIDCRLMQSFKVNDKSWYEKFRHFIHVIYAKLFILRLYFLYGLCYACYGLARVISVPLENPWVLILSGFFFTIYAAKCI